MVRLIRGEYEPVWQALGSASPPATREALCHNQTRHKHCKALRRRPILCKLSRMLMLKRILAS